MMSATMQPHELLRQRFEALLAARRDAYESIREILPLFESEARLPGQSADGLAEAVSLVMRLQEECERLLPADAGIPATIAELAQLCAKMESEATLAARTEQAREAIQLFTQLHCLDEELADEFMRHQLAAEKLLLHPPTDDALTEAGEVYDMVIRLIRHPEQIENKPAAYRQITKSIGFVTRYALEQGVLVWPEDDSPAVKDAPLSEPAPISADGEAAAAEQAPVPGAMPAEADPADAVSTPAAEPPSYVPALPENTRRLDFDALSRGSNFKVKDKNSFSVNKFESEMKQSSPEGINAAFVMGFIYNFGLLAAGQLDDFLSSGETTRTTLLKLTQKGYLAEHTIELGNTEDACYVLTEYGAAAFRRETSRKYLTARLQHIKLAIRPADDDIIRLDPQRPAASVYRLRAVNFAQHRLERALRRDFAHIDTACVPFPYRKLRCDKTGRRFVLFCGALDAVHPHEDWHRAIEMLRQAEDCIPLAAAESADEGLAWTAALHDAGISAYAFVFDGEVLSVRDASGADCFAALFGGEPAAVEAQPDGNALNAGEEPAEDAQPPAGESAPAAESADADAVPADTLSADSQPVDTMVFLPENPSAAERNTEAAGAADGAAAGEPIAAVSGDELGEVVTAALRLLAEDRRAEGMLLLHAAADHSEDVAVLRNKFAFILGDPLRAEEDWHSLADTPITLPFYDSEMLDDCLNAALWLRIFFEPDNPNDYRLNNRWRQINDDLSSRALESYPGIKQLIGYFWSFIERYQVGLKYCASTDVRDQLDMTQALEHCRQDINETVNSAFSRNVKANINHPKIHQMMTDLYGNTGILTRILQEAFTMPLQKLRDICQLFTGDDLSAIADDTVIVPHDHKLEQYIDKHWAGMDFKSHAGKSDALTGALRGRMTNKLREATEPLLRCYALRRQAELNRATTEINAEIVSATRQRTMELIDAALSQLEQTEAADDAGRSALRAVIRHFQDVLGDPPADPPHAFYEPLLLTGEIELDKDCLPVLDWHWQQGTPYIKGFRLWERVLRHAGQTLPSWEEAAGRALRDYDMGTYDLIVSLTKEWYPEQTVRDTRRRAELQLAKYKDDFMADVESAQNYGQMASNDEMYGYFRLAEAAERHAQATGNAGFFKRLLEACRRQIHQGSDARIAATRNRLEALKRDILHDPDRQIDESDEDVLAQWPILDKIERMLEKRNITVAEDYIQLALSPSRQRDTPSIQRNDKDLYAQFERSYQPLFNACNSHKRDDLYRTYDQSVRSLLFPGQNNRNTASADKFIRAWFKPQQLSEFMEQLIFHKVERFEKKRDGEYYVYPAARDAKLGQYPHPFEAFGTGAVRNGLRVLTMAGVRSADNVLDEVAQRGAGGGAATIVILDYALSLAERRQLAKSIKLRSLPEIIVVIDRVMALFLAGFSQIERYSAFLMVALPSSKVQPYIPVGSIPPEMFIGRTEELEKIQNLNGPVFVYGGRQLGKTALLRESRNREHDPANGRYAIYIDLKEKGVDAALAKIGEELVAERILQQPCATWDELRIALRARLSAADKPIRKLILLLDEADAFIASCEHVQYRPLEMLKELKDLFNNQFKFVLAGLRDVVRFNKQLLGGNSVLAVLGNITIRPLKYLDARDLLLRPLQYLGFRIGENGEDIISLILAKTNYYPGLIHFYCQKLIEAIGDSYRNGNFSDSSAPPYVLDEKHIKTLLGQSEFLTEIETKFRITLQLDADNLYDILAKAMAFHYYEAGVGQGASVQDIMRICRDFEIRKIVGLTEENVTALMEEMVELNIFRQEARDTGKYVFNRYSFFQMLGNQEQVFEHLIQYSGTGEA